MDKQVSKKHTKEKKFKEFSEHGPLILLHHVSLQLCVSTHSTFQSYTLSYRHAKQENATFSIFVQLQQIRYQWKSLET